MNRSGNNNDKVTRELLELVSAEVQKVEGVSAMGETLSDTLKTIPGITSPVKGVRIAEEDDELEVDLYVNVCYKTNIPQLAWDIQNHVKQVLTEQISIPIKSIDIHVQGVDPKEERI